MAARGAPVGNTNAKKGKLIEDLLRKVCVQESNARIVQGLGAILDKAADGDLRCLEFVRDTFDGKPAQSVEVTGDSENPLVTKTSHSMDTDAIELLSKIRGLK